MTKVGWWLAGAALPVAIWPALDWSQAIALALTQMWFERTGHMPSWTETATVEVTFAILLAAVSGLVLFAALRAVKKAGAPNGVGWLAAALSVVILLVAARAALGVSVAAVISRSAPGLAMAGGAVLAQLWRRQRVSPVAD